jgi:hypothetical protein
MSRAVGFPIDIIEGFHLLYVEIDKEDDSVRMFGDVDVLR